MRFSSEPIYLYIYYIYTPNLGSEVAVPGREREQGRFRGSTEGAQGSTEGARESIEGARESVVGAGGSTEGAGGSSKGALGAI